MTAVRTLLENAERPWGLLRLSCFETLDPAANTTDDM